MPGAKGSSARKFAWNYRAALTITKQACRRGKVDVDSPIWKKAEWSVPVRPVQTTQTSGYTFPICTIQTKLRDA